MKAATLGNVEDEHAVCLPYSLLSLSCKTGRKVLDFLLCFCRLLCRLSVCLIVCHVYFRRPICSSVASAKNANAPTIR